MNLQMFSKAIASCTFKKSFKADRRINYIDNYANNSPLSDESAV